MNLFSAAQKIRAIGKKYDGTQTTSASSATPSPRSYHRNCTHLPATSQPFILAAQFTLISLPQIAHFQFTSFHSTKHAIPTNIKMATNLPTVVSQTLNCTPNPNMTTTFNRREGFGKLTRAGSKQEAHTQCH